MTKDKTGDRHKDYGHADWTTGRQRHGAMDNKGGMKHRAAYTVGMGTHSSQTAPFSSYISILKLIFYFKLLFFRFW